MILKETNFQEVIVGAEKTMDFTIDTDNSLIFEILRDKMYKDKIGSICREVMSNCRDANRESGSKENISVTIIEPNQFTYIGHQSVSFRDHGVGITPERMFNVYINYASSTKRGSNKQTGGFGLGAKTPFAYNDTFTVITVCDVDGVRMKYYYTALIDSSRKGKMVLFDSEETTEDTGTQVIVPIKTISDRREFEEKAFFYTKYWGCVDYVNFNSKPEPLKILYTTNEFDIVEGVNTSLIIDGIPFPLETSGWGFVNLSMVNNMAIALKFNTGDLTISANRESIQYDEDTVDKIKNKAQLVYDWLAKYFQNFTTNFSSYIEACMFKVNLEEYGKQTFREGDLMFNILTSAIGYPKGYNSFMLTSLYKNTELTYDDRKLVTSLRFKHHNIISVYNTSRYSIRKVYETLNSLSLRKHLEVGIYYLDTKKDSRRNLTIFDEASEDSFILIEPNVEDSTEQDIDLELFEIINYYGIKLENYSEVVPTITRRDSRKIDSSKIPAYIYNRYGNIPYDLYYSSRDKKFYQDEGKTVEVDTEKTCFKLVEYVKSTSQNSKDEMNFLRDNDWNVVLINHSHYRKLSKVKHYTVETATKHLKDLHMDSWIEKGTLQILKSSVDVVSSSLIPFLGIIGDKILPKTYSKFKVQDWTEHKSENVKGYNMAHSNIKISEEGLTNKIKKNLSRYPMLLTYIKYSGEGIKEKEVQIKEYINLIESKK